MTPVRTQPHVAHPSPTPDDGQFGRRATTRAPRPRPRSQAMRRGRYLGRRIGGAFVVWAGALAGCQQPMPYYVVCPQPGTVATVPQGTIVTSDAGTTVAYGDVCSVAG